MTWFSYVILIAAIIYMTRRLSALKEENITLSKSVSRLKAELAVLKSFICESKSLSEQYRDFTESSWRRHSPLVEGCVCDNSADKDSIQEDMHLFYEYDEKRNPEKYNYEPDGLSLLEDDNFRKWCDKNLIPCLETLSSVEPERVNVTNIDWLKKCESQTQAWQYLSWLIPKIESSPLGLHKPLSNQESIDLVNKLKEFLSGKGDW